MKRTAKKKTYSASDLANDVKNIAKVAREELEDLKVSAEELHQELLDAMDKLPDAEDLVKFATMVRKRQWHQAATFFFHLDPDDQDDIAEWQPALFAKLKATNPTLFEENGR